MPGSERAYWTEPASQPEIVDWRKVRLGQVSRRHSDKEPPLSDRTEVVGLVRSEIAATKAEMNLGVPKPLDPVLWSILQVWTECAQVNPMSADHLMRMAVLQYQNTANVDANTMLKLLGDEGSERFKDALCAAGDLPIGTTRFPLAWREAFDDLVVVTSPEPAAQSA